jgi:lipopolysaccharide/colanic/teichoic acid biosynthesis glycosyltransferase
VDSTETTLHLPNSALRLKRILDCLGAGAGLVFLTPVLLLIAVGIRIDTPGSILFRQVRIGKGGRSFQMLKFRSMYAGVPEMIAEELGQDPQERLSYQQHQKLQNDPRRTRCGRFLRKTSLDELPQLWNVLSGEMSLVGPRPFLPEQREFYGPSYSLYIQFRPGITGLWQVSGRNQLSFQERVELDAVYFENWSLWLDLKILLRTIWIVLSRRGAY